MKEKAKKEELVDSIRKKTTKIDWLKSACIDISKETVAKGKQKRSLIEKVQELEQEIQELKHEIRVLQGVEKENMIINGRSTTSEQSTSSIEAYNTQASEQEVRELEQQAQELEQYLQGCNHDMNFSAMSYTQLLVINQGRSGLNEWLEDQLITFNRTGSSLLKEVENLERIEDDLVEKAKKLDLEKDALFWGTETKTTGNDEVSLLQQSSIFKVPQPPLRFRSDQLEALADKAVHLQDDKAIDLSP